MTYRLKNNIFLYKMLNIMYAHKVDSALMETFQNC